MESLNLPDLRGRWVRSDTLCCSFLFQSLPFICTTSTDNSIQFTLVKSPGWLKMELGETFQYLESVVIISFAKIHHIGNHCSVPTQDLFVIPWVRFRIALPVILQRNHHCSSRKPCNFSPPLPRIGWWTYGSIRCLFDKMQPCCAWACSAECTGWLKRSANTQIDWFDSKWGRVHSNGVLHSMAAPSSPPDEIFCLSERIIGLVVSWSMTDGALHLLHCSIDR